MELSARLPVLPALLGRSSALAGAGNSRNMDRRGSRASWVKPQTQQPRARPGRGLGEILILVTGWKLVLPPSTQSAGAQARVGGGGAGVAFGTHSCFSLEVSVAQVGGSMGDHGCE